MNKFNLVIVFIFFYMLSIYATALEVQDLTLKPGDSEITTIKKVPVSDCLIVRGFWGTPVDGSVKSWDYRGTVREYPKTASDGVVYSFNNNDGVHITLSDDKGFDLVVLRGGAYTRMYLDKDNLTEPEDKNPTWEFNGDKPVASCYLSRQESDKVSFFGTKDGAISDVSFYRVEKGNFDTNNMELWSPGDGEVELKKPESEFAPESVYKAINERYDEGERRTLPLFSGKGSGSSINVQKDQAIHFITPPFGEEKGLASIILSLKISGKSEFPLILAVQDPLNPRLDVTWVEFIGEKSGTFRVELDIPDQVIFKNSHLWITLKSGMDITIEKPEFWLKFVSREAALPEALAWRKLLLKSYFSLMSEPRPWGGYGKRSREEFYSSNQYAAQCPELFMTIDQCYALDPADDMVRQYREWVYARNLDSFSEVSPLPQPPKGVPDWAWYPRLAWLEVRRIAKWWLDERLVPTGELGGRVGDDSDMYQQFTDLPFFEDGEFADLLLDSGAKMAELADKENLRGGLNIHATDSLHAYEEGMNHLALMSRWFYGDPIYLERCMESARNMESLTIVTEDGRRHIRTIDRMGAEDIDKPRQPTMDGGTNPLMWHTAFQVADYNRNPRTLKILREWADTWLKFMKPGEWATTVEVLSGKVTDSQPDRPLYGGYSTQATTFTWLYGLTGDKGYLEPFMYYYRQGKANYPANGFLGDTYILGALDDLDKDTLSKIAEDSPSLNLYLNNDPKQLIDRTIGNPDRLNQGISTLYDGIRFPDMYTNSHQFTDRIFPDLIEKASVAYLGGFCRRNKFNPTLAVSWEGFGTDYGAMVTENKPDGLKVMVYSFADVLMQGKMRVWALEHGIYKLTIGLDRNETLELAKGDEIELTIQPRTVTLIELKQEKKLDDIFSRPDLAITARELKIKDNAISGIIHNIGSADAKNVVIAVFDDSGKLVVSKSLGDLSAPVDLFPKRLPFSIQLPDKPGKGWKIVVNPDKGIPEIYRGNNEVDL